jgi:hypothetical protein
MLGQKKIALGCILFSFFSCNDSKDNISEPNRIEVKVDSIVPSETSDNILGIYEKDYFYQEDIKNVPFNIDSSASIDRFRGGWTNGNVWFGIQESDSVISMFVEGAHPFVSFEGGDRHEGGYMMSGVLINDSSIFVLGSNISPVEKGDLLVESIYFDKKCIVVFDREGEFKDVLIDSEEAIGSDVGILIQENLAGKFCNKQTNDTIEFFEVGAHVVWNGDEKEFILEIGEYEQLAHVFTLSNKEENSLDQELTAVVSYAFERSGNNLSLIRAYFEEEEGDMEGWAASGDTLNFTLIEKSKELSMNQFKKNVFAVF